MQRLMGEYQMGSGRSPSRDEQDESNRRSKPDAGSKGSLHESAFYVR